MNILIVGNGKIPVSLYGGTERVIWYLGKELTKLGHRVTYLVNAGSFCDFAKVIIKDDNRPIAQQIPKDVDVIHFNYTPKGLKDLTIPYIVTMHGNANHQKELDKNTVFVSKNHAERYGSKSYVYNGLDWEDYSIPNLKQKREYFHFLANAAWRVKNVKGAIEVIKASKTERLKVLGGVRFNLKMGIRLTFSPKISFAGMVGGKQKDQLINRSKGLIFPVLWHEPFGLAIIESLYFGCPIFATPYGSLPELINQDVGFLSNKKQELTQAIKQSESFSKKRCNEYAQDEFNSKKMALHYLEKYEIVLNNANLNSNAPKLKQIQTEKFLEWK